MPGYSRRDCLKLCLSLVGATSISPVVWGSAANSAQLMRAIPSSGEEIPVVGLGTARTFDIAPDTSQLSPLLDVVRLFLVRGGTMIDSSPMYGQAERVVGEIVSRLNLEESIFFATKVWTTGREAGTLQMEKSFRLMATDRIDLMQVHNLVDTRVQLNSIRELILQEKVRYAGVTHHSANAFDELESWIKNEKLDFVQFPYSIVNRQAERRLLAVAADRGVATIAHRNFEKGRLFNKVKGMGLPPWASEFDCATWGNFFLKYVMADPRLTNVIPATRKAKHLLDNMNAGLGRLPDSEQRRRMVDLIEAL